MSWLENTDADYDALCKKWENTWLVYTGEYSDLENLDRFLHKRSYFEKQESYDLRMNTVDPDLSLFTIISSIIGQAFATEEDDQRTFEDEEFAGIIDRLWDDIDGEGTSYPVFWKNYASRQLVFQWFYVLVEGITVDGETKTQEARIKLIRPDMVLAKGDGWMKVKHTVIKGQDDPTAEQKEVDQYTVYGLDGWTRYEKTDKGSEVVIDEGEYTYYTDTARTRKRLPIFLVSLPFPTYISHYLARKVVSNFNLQSCIDTYASEGTITLLIDDADVMTHEHFKDEKLAGESHVNMEGKAYYVAPPEGPAKMGREWLMDKRKELQKTALQQFADAAKQTTATEIRYKSKSSIEAFLNLFVSTIEETENTCLFLLEQVYFPDQPSRWGKSRVARSKKFQVLDPTEMLRLMLDIVFGTSPIPVTDDMVYDVVKTIWEDHLCKSLPEEQEEPLKRAISLMLEEREGTSRNRNPLLLEEEFDSL